VLAISGLKKVWQTRPVNTLVGVLGGGGVRHYVEFMRVLKEAVGMLTGQGLVGGTSIEKEG